MSGADAQPNRRPRLSLRLKLTLWIVLLSGVIQLTLVLLAVFYLHLTLAGFFDNRLLAGAAEISESLNSRADPPQDADLKALAEDTHRFGGFEKLAITLYTPDGRAIASSIRPAPALDHLGNAKAVAKLSGPAGLLTRREVPGLGAPARILIQRLHGAGREPLILAIAAPDRTYQAMTGVMARVIGFAVPAGILAAAVAGWLVGGMAVAPLERFRRLAQSLAPEALGRRPSESPAPFREAAELERTLEETRAKLNYAFQAQDRFIANVSHELKTPIAVVLAESQVLSREGTSPEARRFAQSAGEEMQRLAGMIEKFLVLTKLQSGTAGLAAAPVEVNSIAMEAIVNSHKMAAQFGVEIVPELWDSDPPLEVLGDAEQLQIMLANLLHNAVRFSPRGRTVGLRIVGSPGRCSIIVRDHGTAVPAELLGTLFDRFGADPGPNRRGHSVGLAISQGIAELHGGTITAASPADGGCEFTVALPRAPARAAGSGV